MLIIDESDRNAGCNIAMMMTASRMMMIIALLKNRSDIVRILSRFDIPRNSLILSLSFCLSP